MKHDFDHGDGAITMSVTAYRRRDYRLKCRCCKRWMRKQPTEKTPTRRAPPPNASKCVDCLKMEAT